MLTHNRKIVKRTWLFKSPKDQISIPFDWISLLYRDKLSKYNPVRQFDYLPNSTRRPLN